MEYPKLEGTNRDHQVQLLAPRRNTPKSDLVSGSIVQMRLELDQAQCCDHCPGEPVPVHLHSNKSENSNKFNKHEAVEGKF